MLTQHIVKLRQQKATLEAKLKLLKEQDEAILAPVSEDVIEIEIEQADKPPPQNAISTQKNIPTVKLPKVNLKTFQGDPESWATFLDAFES